MGGITVCCGVERNVIFTQIAPPLWLKLVAVIPDITVETKRAREVLPEKIAMTDAVFNLQRVALQIASWYSPQNSTSHHFFDDRLHQPYRRKLIPGFEDVLSAAREANASGVYLSGSGPTIMALYHKSGKTIGQGMVEAFKRSGISSRFALLKPVAGHTVVSIT